MRRIRATSSGRRTPGLYAQYDVSGTHTDPCKSGNYPGVELVCLPEARTAGGGGLMGFP